MWFKRRPSPPARPPATPPGERVYAIGDVHGRLDLLLALEAMIAADNAQRGPAQTRIILLGDLIDRGPDSAGVVAYVRSRPELCLLKGNHEELFVEAARGDSRAVRRLLEVGGAATLASYGIAPEEANAGSYADLARLLVERIPREDVDFLDAAPDSVQVGDYLFVHAGIRPGVPLDRQLPGDLRWIRREFVSSARDHGVVVVHGHSITAAIDARPNRIGIDTGAWASGVLTAIGIEGEDRWYLATHSDSTPA